MHLIVDYLLLRLLCGMLLEQPWWKNICFRLQVHIQRPLHDCLSNLSRSQESFATWLSITTMKSWLREVVLNVQRYICLTYLWLSTCLAHHIVNDHLSNISLAIYMPCSSHCKWSPVSFLENMYHEQPSIYHQSVLISTCFRVCLHILVHTLPILGLHSAFASLAQRVI